MFEKNSWFIYHTNFLSSFNTVGPLDLLIFICGPINRHKNNWSLDQLPSVGRTNLPVICEKNSCSLDRLHAVLDDRGGGGVQVEATGQNPIVVVKPWVGVLLLGHRETRQYTPCNKCLSQLTDKILLLRFLVHISISHSVLKPIEKNIPIIPISFYCIR